MFFLKYSAFSEVSSFYIIYNGILGYIIVFCHKVKFMEKWLFENTFGEKAQ